ncbi:phosphoglucomutase/phosphomannomutase family protein [Candidatus Acetothermia bacterium]|nr:phosphoglucomutase/phosphomannomutase family protein [Candidatus Acetothermia bacterium]
MSETTAIRFGTDGWRGVIAKDFTFANVARVASAIAQFLVSKERRALDVYHRWGVEYRGPERGVVVGYDTRFLSREFAIHLGQILQDHKIPVLVSKETVPTPALSYAIREHKAAAGVMITASHNPAEYNGIKVKLDYGGPAPPQATQIIEKLLPSEVPEPKTSEHELNFVDFRDAYLARVRQLIDTKLLKGAPLFVMVDAMYGSGRGYLAELLKDLEIRYALVRGGDNPRFGGKNPEPIEKNLSPLRAVMASEKLRKKSREFLVGVVTDGDGDRVGAMDELGQVIDSHRCFALILRHLLSKGWTGKVVKSFTLSDMVDKICVKHRIEMEEVPVGFKFACEKMIREDVLMGGEESGGFGIKHHIPERDGILMSLLLLEIVAKAGKPASQVVEDLMQDVGYHYYDRRDLHLETGLEIVDRVKRKPPKEIAGFKVQKIELLDGIKLRFSHGWLLMRASGTEPLLRLYCEMDTPEKVKIILDEAERFAQGEMELWVK